MTSPSPSAQPRQAHAVDTEKSCLKLVCHGSLLRSCKVLRTYCNAKSRVLVVQIYFGSYCTVRRGVYWPLVS